MTTGGHAPRGGGKNGLIFREFPDNGDFRWVLALFMLQFQLLVGNSLFRTEQGIFMHGTGNLSSGIGIFLAITAETQGAGESYRAVEPAAAGLLLWTSTPRANSKGRFCCRTM
jgi:hypothetical protein